MSEVLIVTENDSLRASGSLVAGKIWLEIEGVPFPMERWDDCVVVVLSWWAAALVKLLSGNSRSESVHFMEGPYVVEIVVIPMGMFQFRAVEGIPEGKEILIGQAFVGPFVQRILMLSKEVLEICARKGWWSMDSDKLKASLQVLDK